MPFRPIPNDAHTRFFRIVLDKVVTAAPCVRNALGTALINLLEVLVGKEDELMRWAGTGVLAEQIAESGSRLGRAFTGFAAYVRAAVYNPVHALAEAAKRLKDMLKKYGRVSRKSCDSQAGDIKTVLENLDGPYAADVTALGIGGLRDALQAAFDEFEALLKEREDAGKQKPDYTFPEVRREIEAVYRQIEYIVNAGAALGSSTGFAAFIDGLNRVIERFRIEFRYVRYDIKDAQPAPIPDQPWTGEECTPVPSSVLFKKGGRQLKLRLGRHYDVSYKSNIDVGNAYCIIHGKGRYNGSKSVTFTIRHGAINAEWNAEIEEAAAAKAEEAKKKKAAAKAKKTAKAAVVAAKTEAAPPKTETAKPVEAKAEAKAAKKAKAADK
jgi:hypothetical protein